VQSSNFHGGGVIIKEEDLTTFGGRNLFCPFYISCSCFVFGELLEVFEDPTTNGFYTKI
jgi:hypothetical protein